MVLPVGGRPYLVAFAPPRWPSRLSAPRLARGTRLAVEWSAVQRNKPPAERTVATMVLGDRTVSAVHAVTTPR